MSRDFSAIKTLDEAKEALIGSKVVALEGGKKFIFETMMGERFSFIMTPEPLPINIGTISFTIAPTVSLKFANEEEAK